jgi:hypothetical protein
MRIFLTVWILLAVALSSQLVIWRLRLPPYRYQMQTLLLIVGAVFCLWLLTPWARSSSFVELLNIIVSYFSLGLGYMVIYSAINVDSPTLSLMIFLAERRVEGRSADEVDLFLAQRPFVTVRLGTLVNSGLIREQNGRWIIAGKGSLAFRFILSYRKLYGPIPKGG